MRLPGVVVLFGAVFVGVGCGPGTPPPPALPPLVPVRGTVLYQGKPLEGVEVVFHPLFDMGTAKFTPSAKTGADGTFALNSGKDGAPVGNYAVTFTYPDPKWDPQDGGQPVDRWKGRYNDPTGGRFKATVKEGDNQLEPFRLN